MKNLLNRLARIGLMLLLLVDRTPNLGVLANATYADLNIKINKFQVTGDYHIDNTWAIDKSVNKPTLSLPIGTSQNVTYTITATKSESHSLTFEFEVKITNDSDHWGTTFDVDAKIVKPSGSPIIDWTTVETGVVIDKNQTLTKTYQLLYSTNGPLQSGLLPLKVNIRLNPILGSDVYKGKSPSVTDLGTPTTNNGSLIVTDSFVGVGPWTFTNTGSVTYTRSIQSGSVAGVHTVNNTATGDYLGITDSATVTVTTLNARPVAIDQSLTTNEDTALNIVLSGSDADGHVLSFSDVGTPSHGSISGTAPNLIYTPDPNFNGSDSFTFKVFDGFEYSLPGTITIQVVAKDDLPIANDDVESTNEDQPINISVLGNDVDVDGDPITITGFTQPGHGAVTDNHDGTLKYIPTPNFFGNDSFIYTINGGDTALVSITVREVKDAPVAQDDIYTTDEDVTLNVNSTLGVLHNDSDIDGDPLTAILDTNVANGMLTLNPDGSFVYIPNPNFHGTDTFKYFVHDGYGSSSIVTVTIIVNSVNDAPVAVADAYTGYEDTVLLGILPGVLLNDFDNDGDPLTAILVNATTNGTLSFFGDGSFIYSPNPDYVGFDSFTYKVTDSHSESITVIVLIDILPVNDAPVAVNDTYSTNEDTTLNVNALLGVLNNDSDDEGDTLSLALDVNVSNGTLTLNPDGSFTYVPNTNFHGTDTFKYHVNDGDKDSNQATVTITANAVNDAPVAVNDNYSIDEDGTINELLPGVLGNDTDLDGDTITAVLDTDVSDGTLVLNPDGSFTYTPDADFNGTDSFTYHANDGALDSNIATVTITVNATNDVPVAVDDNYSTNEDTTLNVNALLGVLNNDFDDDGDSLSLELDVNVTNGMLTLNPDGSFDYIPNPGFNGTDTFKYHINDGTSDSNQATVTITVTSVNDAPVAVDDSYNTNEDTVITINAASGVLSNDSDPENNPLTATKLTNPSHGVLVYFNANGSFRYRPNLNFFGTDTFTYKVTDSFGAYSTATVTINVASVNDKPDADNDGFSINEDNILLFTIEDLLDNDSDPDYDALTITGFTQPSSGLLTLVGNQFTYLPVPNFFGLASFTYTISDGKGGSDTATVGILVKPVNDNPVAVDDVYSTNEDQTLTINSYSLGVLANDSDVDSIVLFATLLPGGEPTKGTVNLNLNGTFTYTPNLNATGTDTFIYRVRDLLNGSALAVVTINIIPQNDAPYALGDGYSTAEDTTLIIPAPGIMYNDGDNDGDATTVILDKDTTNGSLILGVDGSFTYTPNLNFVGTDSFDYYVNDGVLDSNIVTVVIEVTPINDAPVANPLAFTVVNAGTSTGSVTASDIDVPADTLTFSLLTPATNGSVTVSPTGEYVYTHNGSATLSDSFVFSVTDGQLTSTATVTITVLAAPVINQSPVAIGQALTVLTGGTLGGTVTATDPENDPLVFSLLTGPANGSLVFGVDGSFTYVHNGGPSVSDSFLFEVFDGTSTSNALVTITIIGLPTPPPPAGNTPPVVINGTSTTGFESPITGAVSGSDADGDALTYTLVDGTENGTIVFNPDGSFTYTPNDGFNGSDSFTFIANDGTDDSNTGTYTINVSEEEIIVVPEEETPLVALPFDWFSWLIAALAGILAWLLAFLRPNMKYTLTDGSNNQKVIRRRLAKPDEKTMLVELNDKDMVNLQTIQVEFYKRLAKHCGAVTVNFQLNGQIVHTVTIPEGIDDSFETLIRL